MRVIAHDVRSFHPVQVSSLSHGGASAAAGAAAAAEARACLQRELQQQAVL